MYTLNLIYMCDIHVKPDIHVCMYVVCMHACMYVRTYVGFVDISHTHEHVQTHKHIKTHINTCIHMQTHMPCRQEDLLVHTNVFT